MEAMRFTHIRNIGGVEVAERTKNGRVCPAFVKGGGHISVAYTHDQEKGFDGLRTITAAFTFCSPEEKRFLKIRGRGQARSAFLKDNTHTIELTEESINQSIMKHVVQSIDLKKMVETNDFDHDSVAPRWLQSIVFIEAMTPDDGCCDDAGCGCE